MEITKTDKGWEYDGILFVDERSALGVKRTTEQENNTITLSELELRNLLDTYGKAHAVSYYLDEMSDEHSGPTELVKFNKKWKELFGEEYK